MIQIKSALDKEIKMNINTFKRIMKEVDTKRHTLEGRKAVVAHLNKQLPVTYFPSNDDGRSIELHQAIVADKGVMDALKVLIEQGIEICIAPAILAPKDIGIDERVNLVISTGTNLNTIRKFFELPTS